MPCSRRREHGVPRPSRIPGTCSRSREHGTQISCTASLAIHFVEPWWSSARSLPARDSSLNFTIPELPGFGWLAAVPEATPQTHSLRPWGFPTVSPSHPSVFPHHGIQRITVEFSGIVPNYPIGRLTVRAALRGPQCLLTRSVSDGPFQFCRNDLRQSSLTLRVSVERNRRCQGRDAVNPRPWDDPSSARSLEIRVRAAGK